MVKLKTIVPKIAVPVISATTRTSTPLGTSMGFFTGRFAGEPASFGMSSANAMPQAIAASPGTTNAERHPTYWISSPVDTAAAAMPRLPARPLMPMVRPAFFESRTSIGMPIGW